MRAFCIQALERLSGFQALGRYVDLSLLDQWAERSANAVYRFVKVHVLAALPLRSLSRLWGTLNTLELPVWMRPTGFKLYAWIFGCNLDEMREPDLTKYASLGEFFYRELAEGVRPIANTALVCISIYMTPLGSNASGAG